MDTEQEQFRCIGSFIVAGKRISMATEGDTFDELVERVNAYLREIRDRFEPYSTSESRS